MNKLTVLGTQYAIIQAPMAGVQDSALCIAVSNAGGLGSLPCAMLSPEQLQAELLNINRGTALPYNLNFFCHHAPVLQAQQEQQWRNCLQPFFDEYAIDAKQIAAGAIRQPFSQTQLDIIAPFKPPIVSFHFGLPASELLSTIKQWGAKILASATTVKEAQWLQAHGADMIIAQGLEAGGHRGMFLTKDLTTQLGSLALLPQIIQAVSIPVIAAGGFADAKTVAAALALGAKAVQVGTAYLLCDELKTSPLHRAALKSEQAQHTAITNVFTGRPARSIVNRAVVELGPINNSTPPFPLAATAISALKIAAEKQQCSDFSALWCGQNATGCQEIPAAELTLSLLNV